MPGSFPSSVISIEPTSQVWEVSFRERLKTKDSKTVKKFKNLTVPMAIILF